jgi:tetratricopeptide (TPR) repeat protein
MEDKMKRLLLGTVLCVMFFAAGTISAQSPELYYKRGEDHFMAGRYQEAITALSEAIRLDSGYVEAWYLRGYANMNLQNFDRAIADYSQLLILVAPLGDLNEFKSTVYYYRGMCYGLKQNAQDADRAIADFTEAIRLNPGNHNAYTFRGDIYRVHKQNWTQARADYEQALRINPNNATARERLNAMR